MKWVISLAVFILFACRCSSLSPSPPVDVFTSGEGGYMCIRIPVILETPQGLIAMAEGRGLHSNNFNCCVSPVEDFPYCNDKDIVMKVSKDDGNTWTPLIVVFETGADYFYSNPSPVFHSNYMYMVYTRCSIASNYDDCTVFFGYSTFDNQWNVIQNFNTPPIAPLSGPGAGIIDSGQTMLFPITTSAGTYVISTSAQSPSSLSAGGFVPPQGTAGESQITQLPDGRLVIQIRGPTSHWISYSSDNGTTWSSATVLGDLPATNCEASLFYSSTLDLLLYSTPADNENDNRSNVTIYLSSDSGVHFSPYVLVYNGPSAYSSLFQNSNGTVGVLFERGVKSPYEAISLSYLV